MDMNEKPNQIDPMLWGQHRAAEANWGLRVYTDLQPNDLNSIILWQALYMMGAVLATNEEGKEEEAINELNSELRSIIDYFRQREEEPTDDSE